MFQHAFIAPAVIALATGATATTDMVRPLQKAGANDIASPTRKKGTVTRAETRLHTVVSVAGATLLTRDQEAKEHIHEVPASTRIMIDGKSETIQGLTQGMRIRVWIQDGVVILISTLERETAK